MTNIVHRPHARFRVRATIIAAALLAFTALLPTTVSADKGFQEGTIRFGVPPWPGLTVKTAVVSRLFEALGYETETRNIGNSIAFQGVADRSLDVFMGYWSPNMDSMVQKYLDAGSVNVIANNVDDAESGIAVPQYVWETGVHSIADLDERRERFDGKIYGIEEGSGLNKIYRDAIGNDTAGLGDWELVPSSTSGMLLAVERAFKRDEWVAWGAWSPHWMMKAYDARILANPSEDGLLKTSVTIKTVVPSGLREFDANTWRLLSQVQLSQATQSAWIYEYDRKDRSLDEVASTWIEDNPKTVASWLEGVETRSGEPAIDAVREAY